MPAIWRNQSSHWRRGPRRSNRCRAHARKRAATARRGRRSCPQPGQGVSRGRYGRVAAKNRDAGQADKPAPRRDRDAGDADRRIEEPELENAVMREVVEARRKRPGCRPAAPVEQGEDASGRPSAPDVFTQPDGMLARVSRRAAAYCHHARLGVDKYAGLLVRVAEAFAASKGRYGYRRIRAALRTRNEVLVPVDDCIHWHDHERIKRSLGWMSPIQYRQSQGMAA
mgnify:CR=1 FL=1